ncbi:hypothetical protein C0Q70_02060 [Pomacea canaliculata]|uniref:Peptidase S1 domain-containing protein n=1 Tax=Pomacea canaliculata TaxID=400727 RepID=A0A2T7Q1B0_POMCA|nr:hypothetical protein C0Q70_02060 [Pomacea canaliculata]
MLWADGAHIHLEKANLHSSSWSWLVSLMSDVRGITRNLASPHVASDVTWSHQHFCGGSVLNQYWILTASHCFDRQAGGNEPATWRARFSDDGFQAHKLRTGWKSLSGQLASKAHALGVSQIVRHPRYNRTNVVADIALVRLSSAISTLSSTHKIATAPLPLHENITFKNGTDCVTTGWKCPRSAREHSSCVAYVVPMPINHPDMCKVYAMDDWSDKLCAGKKNARQGVCGGDSGDALMCEIHGGEMVMAGFLSFVHKDDPFAFPSGYTAVQPYLNLSSTPFPSILAVANPVHLTDDR